MTDPDPNEPIEFEINSELDLHTFRPSEVGELLPDYIGLCLEKGITRVRIIHGKGTGTLRETVHAILKRDMRVERFSLAGPCGRWMGRNHSVVEGVKGFENSVW